jgi:hypothetical protein
MEATMVHRSATKLSDVRSSLSVIGAALAAAAAVISCGDEQQDDHASATAATSDRADRVVRRYFAAFARGDGRAACGLMTNVAREGLRQLPEGKTPRSCEEAVTVLRRSSLTSARPRVGELQVAGRRATARVTSKQPPYDNSVLLRRDRQGWKIAFPPAVLNRFDTPPGIRPHDDEPHEDR